MAKRSIVTIASMDQYILERSIHPSVPTEKFSVRPQWQLFPVYLSPAARPTIKPTRTFPKGNVVRSYIVILYRRPESHGKDDLGLDFRRLKHISSPILWAFNYLDVGR